MKECGRGCEPSSLYTIRNVINGVWMWIMNVCCAHFEPIHHTNFRVNFKYVSSRLFRIHFMFTLKLKMVLLALFVVGLLFDIWSLIDIKYNFIFNLNSSKSSEEIPNGCAWAEQWYAEKTPFVENIDGFRLHFDLFEIIENICFDVHSAYSWQWHCLAGCSAASLQNIHIRVLQFEYKRRNEIISHVC